MDFKTPNFQRDVLERTVKITVASNWKAPLFSWNGMQSNNQQFLKECRSKDQPIPIFFFFNIFFSFLTIFFSFNEGYSSFFLSFENGSFQTSQNGRMPIKSFAPKSSNIFSSLKVNILFYGKMMLPNGVM